MKNEENIPKSCLKVGHYIDKDQYNETSFWESLHLQLHIINCQRCKQYNKMSQKLTNLLNKTKLNALQKKEKEELKNRLKF